MICNLIIVDWNVSTDCISWHLFCIFALTHVMFFPFHTVNYLTVELKEIEPLSYENGTKQLSSALSNTLKYPKLLLGVTMFICQKRIKWIIYSFTTVSSGCYDRAELRLFVCLKSVQKSDALHSAKVLKSQEFFSNASIPLRRWCWAKRTFSILR